MFQDFWTITGQEKKSLNCGWKSFSTKRSRQQRGNGSLCYSRIDGASNHPYRDFPIQPDMSVRYWSQSTLEQLSASCSFICWTWDQCSIIINPQKNGGNQTETVWLEFRIYASCQEGTNEERVFSDLTLWQPEMSRLCLCVLLWRRHSVSMRPLIWTWAPLTRLHSAESWRGSCSSCVVNTGAPCLISLLPSSVLKCTILWRRDGNLSAACNEPLRPTEGSTDMCLHMWANDWDPVLLYR